jgi:hypothetical protein
MTTKLKTTTPTTPTTEPTDQLAVPAAPMSGIVGEVDAQDFSLCYLSLCQKSGQLADDFKPGNFVFGKAIDLGTAALVIPIRATKFYEEDCPFGTGTGRIWTRRADIPEEEAFREAANIDFLVKIEQSVSALSVTHNNETWACARFVVRKSSYSIFKTLVTDTSGFLKGGLYTGRYQLISEKRSNDKNSWYVPTLRAEGPVVSGLIEEIKATLHI